MENQITKPEETQALLSQVVETKVTRTELLDLIVERVIEELDLETKQLEKERDGIETSLSLTSALDLLKFRTSDARISVEKQEEYRGFRERVPTHFELKIKVDLPLDVAFPKKYVEANARHTKLRKQIDEIRWKRSRLQNGKTKARNEMVKHALENTPEGAKILEAIDGLKEHVKQKLLATGSQQ